MFLGQPFTDAAGQTKDRVHGSATNHLNNMVVLHAGLDDRPGQLQTHLANNPQNVALGHGSIRSHDKIRAAQDIEVSSMVGDIERTIEKLTQLLGRAGWVNMEEVIQRFGRRQVVGFRTNAADALGYLGHIFGQPPLGKLLKASQLRNLEVGILHPARIVKEDFNFAVTFQPSDRVNGYPFHFTFALLNRESGRL